MKSGYQKKSSLSYLVFIKTRKKCAIANLNSFSIEPNYKRVNGFHQYPIHLIIRTEYKMSNLTNSNTQHHKSKFNSIIMLMAAASLLTTVSVSNAKNSKLVIKYNSTTQNAKANKRSIRKIYLGSAPYICSPSGFGRTSSCKLRTRIN